jgi:hypothetical protein
VKCVRPGYSDNVPRKGKETKQILKIYRIISNKKRGCVENWFYFKQAPYLEAQY